MKNRDTKNAKVVFEQEVKETVLWNERLNLKNRRRRSVMKNKLLIGGLITIICCMMFLSCEDVKYCPRDGDCERGRTISYPPTGLTLTTSTRSCGVDSCGVKKGTSQKCDCL
jgi:hypothetical protein